MISPQSGLSLLAIPLFLVPAALVAPACNSSVETSGTGASAGSGGSTSTGSTGACPADPPADGAACGGPAGDCHYPVACCGDTIATCTAGHWKVQLGPCIEEPQPPPCPDTEPKDGTPCVEQGCLPITCPYGTCPGSMQTAAFASCQGGTWVVTKQCDTGGIPPGGACGPDADGGVCAAGLACCYPCGMPGCKNTCVKACDPSTPGCAAGCMLVP
jgi:hypothetical protein